MRFLILCITVLFLAHPALPECAGINQIDALPEPVRNGLMARADAVPFARGLLWRATKDDRSITLVGTFHLDDPRHDSMMERLSPLIEASSTVLVEAGPLEEAALAADLARDPSLMFITDGPTLPETLPPEVWHRLVQALRDRSIPPFLAARMQPAYLSMILAIPPCAGTLDGTMPDGLDRRIVARAQEGGVPVRALELHDTVFRIFAALGPGDQRAMLDLAITQADRSEDAFHTLAEAYFAEAPRLIWELSILQATEAGLMPPDRVAEDFARMEETLILARNRAWLPVIDAAAEHGPVVAAFGALHLSGSEGVLNLLAQAGYLVERLGP